MDAKRLPSFFRGMALGFLLVGSHHGYAASLSLKQAEAAALEQSPEIKSLQASSKSLEQSAIASGQLADPKLMFNTMNVPVDTFDFSQEPMTQIQVGLQQSFPRGRSLHYRSLQKHDLSDAELHKQEVMSLQILQGVRQSWLNLYYWFNAKQIVIKQKGIFSHLVKVTESMLANNKAQQKDVIRAQLEVTELDNRLLEITQNIDIARAQLGRWVGNELAIKAAPKLPPVWTSEPNLKILQDSIKQHPIIKTDESLISSGHASIKLAEQQYKPGFTLGLAYGFRQGQNVGGGSRSDFLTAQVSMDLPLFTRNRQARTLAASEDQLVSHEENQVSHYRQLLEMLETQFVAWNQQQKSAALYKSRLISEAKQYSEATMTAYQNTQTDFPTLARAYVRELNTELAGLKATVDRDRARVDLLYLQGQ